MAQSTNNNDKCVAITAAAGVTSLALGTGLLAGTYRKSVEERNSYVPGTCDTNEAESEGYPCSARHQETCSTCSNGLVDCQDLLRANHEGPCCVNQYKCCQTERYQCGTVQCGVFPCGTYSCGDNTCTRYCPQFCPRYCDRCVRSVNNYRARVHNGTCWNMEAGRLVFSDEDPDSPAVCGVTGRCGNVFDADNCRDQWIAEQRATADGGNFSCFYKPSQGLPTCDHRFDQPAVDNVAKGFGALFVAAGGIAVIAAMWMKASPYRAWADWMQDQRKRRIARRAAARNNARPEVVEMTAVISRTDDVPAASAPQPDGDPVPSGGAGMGNIFPPTFDSSPDAGASYPPPTDRDAPPPPYTESKA